jgi:PAS domain S-box-containing protein
MDHTAQLNMSMVSPENSEDGNMPTIADTKGSSHMDALLYSQNYSAGLVPMSFPNPIATLASGQNLMMHNNYGQGNPVKRQRLDANVPLMTVSSNATTALISSQQLVAAAAALEQGRGRKKSQAQVDRRRERNRILARRTRLRKKFFFESLQKEVMDLQKENEDLKSIVKDELPEGEAEQILSECDALERMPDSILEACAEESAMENKDFNLVKSIQKSQHAFVITDPSLQDNPIVFASDDFLNMTGYQREQVLGRNCRFLQGTDSNKSTVDKMRKAIENGEDVSATLINYTADGTPFWNKIFIAALRDAQSNIVNYIGVIVKVAGPEPGEEGDALEGVAEEDADNTVKAIEDSVTAALSVPSKSGH